MQDDAIHILLIDDIKLDIREIKSQLGDTIAGTFVVNHLEDFKDSLDLLKKNDPKVDVVLLNLGLTCPHSPKTIFKRIEAVVNDIPIIVITGDNDHELALFVMNSGASDNMTRGDFRNTYGKLRDAINFSLARCLILKSARKDGQDSEDSKNELISYISGAYSVSVLFSKKTVFETPVFRSSRGNKQI